MKLLAPAKLTLDFRIVGLRNDGMHLIESEMTSVSLCDEIDLEFHDHDLTTSQLTLKDALNLESFGFDMQSIPVDSANLVLQAKEACGIRGDTTLVKRIPPGAGLGGGSSDAAAIIRFAGSHLSSDTLVGLGADVPFCVQVNRASVTGVGESLVQLPLLERHFVLFLIPLVIPTAKVYQAYDYLDNENSRGCANTKNDLEEAAHHVSPNLKKYRDLIVGQFGIVPRLAGSGSTYFMETSFKELGLAPTVNGLHVLSRELLGCVAIEVREVNAGNLVNCT